MNWDNSRSRYRSIISNQKKKVTYINKLKRRVSSALLRTKVQLWMRSTVVSNR